MTPVGWADVSVIYCLTNHHIIEWIKITDYLFCPWIWSLARAWQGQHISLLCDESWGRFTGAWRNHFQCGWWLWLPNQTLGQSLSFSPYGPPHRLLELPHSMVAEFQEWGLKREEGSRSCHLLRTGPGNWHSLTFALKSLHQERVTLAGRVAGKVRWEWWHSSSREISQRQRESEGGVLDGSWSRRPRFRGTKEVDNPGKGLPCGW